MTTVGANPANIEPVVFTTSQDLVIAPPKLMAAMTTTAAGDRATDVWDGVRFDAAGVPCFASPELTPGDAFCLGFAESLAGTALRLTIGAEARGIGVDPRNPPLAWEVWNGEAWLRAQVSDDTTGGLNRGGNVVLLIPVEHELLSIGNVAAYWVRVRLLEPQPGQPTYQMSPRVRAITAATLGGTVRAEHSENVPAEVVGRSDGRAAQSFTVSHTPVLPRRDGETVRVTDSDGATEWTEVEDFTRSTEHDRHFAWDSGSGVIRFGPRVRYATARCASTAGSRATAHRSASPDTAMAAGRAATSALAR
jgi:predicted phage baseplate assembly protein